jgi:glycerophosphoryl diester phosphodiesterase
MLPGISLDELHAVRPAPEAGDRDLAARHSPVLRFDAREPFLPSVAGYTVLRQDAPSASFPRELRLSAPGRRPAATVIEYAVWWDWDIGHLYELEHVWVYLDEAGRVVWGEASAHGGWHAVLPEAAVEDGARLVVCAEPGKHALHAGPEAFRAKADDIRFNCGPGAGWMGVHVPPLFEGRIAERWALPNRLVLGHLQAQAFAPSFDFSRRCVLPPEALVPWPALAAWIPGRVRAMVAALERAYPPGKRHIYRIAHRGASAAAPENTLLAIERAAELGADWVELDVRHSADGVPVILHDAELSRTTNGRGPVGDWPVDDLKRLDAGQGQAIPTLDEALRACRRLGLRPYLELKDGDDLPGTLAAVERHFNLSRIITAAFRPDWLAEVKALRPAAATSILFGALPVDAPALARAIGADYVHPCWERHGEAPHRHLTADWLAAARAARLGVIAWHEERPAEIAALQQRDVDGICSNTPERLGPAAPGRPMMKGGEVPHSDADREAQLWHGSTLNMHQEEN